LERVSVEQNIITSIHHDDSDEGEGDVNDNNNNNALTKKRSDSSSSSTSSSPSLPVQSVRTNTTTTVNRNPNKYPSFESLPPSYQNDQNPRPPTKTASLQFGVKPVRDDEPGL
jgi:hypothetical protein